MKQKLSERESQIVRMAAEGLTDKEICRQLGISVSTVKTYWLRIFEKLEVMSRGHAIAELFKSVASDPEHSLRSLIGAHFNHVAIFAISPDHTIASWNPGVKNIFGYTREEFIGKPVDMIFTPEDRMIGIPEKELQICSEKGEAPDNRWHMRKDGSRFWVSGVVTELNDPNGEPIGYAKIVYPIEGAPVTLP